MNKFLLLMSLYLLGYAREASGQPDELPGSMDHKASVQQLSGEYFPLANPSDAESLYESSNDNTLSEHGSSEHGSNEHTVAEHSSGEHSTGEHTSVEHAASEQPSGEHATGEQPSGEQPSGEHNTGEQPSGEHNAGEQPSGEHVGEQPSGEHNAGEQTSGEQASVEQPSGEQPSGEQASGAPISSTSSGVLLNCHTCAYMNDQGKCLRGEGICTTQNSQQCMLKKIFEGGKLQFMVQGCENMCPSMNLFSHGTRMQIICCRNRPFCNKI
ncbi:acrosomal protein SP-10 isoform X1 [Nycticebus coucang]|uniref:acrosomal protein SP-10 isoform X1 n=1 Tax=Nycticebus coucang TaxID=9470 RepID=UPI00234DDC9D|nr:acrosomal protein SP-10 isoform X1 [Nycticebus coucang]